MSTFDDLLEVEDSTVGVRVLDKDTGEVAAAEVHLVEFLHEDLDPDESVTSEEEQRDEKHR